MADLSDALSLWRDGSRLAAEHAVLDLLRHSPDAVQALRFLGEIYASSGRHGESAGVWRRLADLCPMDAAVLRQLAQALLAAGAAVDAIPVLQRAIGLEPGNSRAHNNLGLARLRIGEAEAAVESLQRAVALDPRYALGYANLGLACIRAGRPGEARSRLERALEIDPHLSQARSLLSGLLERADPGASRRERDRALQSVAINLMTLRRHDEAVGIWTRLIDSGAALSYLDGDRFHCRLHSCDWMNYEATARALETRVLDGQRIDRPFSFFVHSENPAAQFRCAETFIADLYPPSAAPRARPARASSAPLRIAYLSFDFHEHATAYLIAGLLEAHDRSRFEITALSFGQNDGGPMRQRLAASVARFIDVAGSTDQEICRLMGELGIDIAVDLKGFTGGARTGLFASRAAPLQLNFLGYPGTMGADYYDYIVADPIVIPSADLRHYAEKVIHLPRCYQPNDARRPLPSTAPGREALGLPADGFVFCCFNNVYKITPALFGVWMSLLRAIEGSVLWLLEGTPTAMRNLRNRAEACGIDPSRLVAAAHIGLPEHLARYRHADLFLDTSPCNAHTTASDALWMGVPVVTLTGATFAGRVATSLLHAVDLPELCTDSLAAYSALAHRLARTPAELSGLKANLESGRTRFALFDTARYCRALEAAYAAIWARHLRGDKPVHLVLPESGAG